MCSRTGIGPVAPIRHLSTLRFISVPRYGLCRSSYLGKYIRNKELKNNTLNGGIVADAGYVDFIEK